MDELENIGTDAAFDYMQIPEKPDNPKESLQFTLKLAIKKLLATQVCQKKEKAYFSGTYIDERDAPIPGVPCLTGLLVTANSPR